jgi:hypothetical protein
MKNLSPIFITSIAVILLASVAFGGVRVPSGDMKLEDGDLRITGSAKGIVFPDSSMQTTAAPANLKTILNGPGRPDNVLNGVDGDFYIDTKFSILYGPKTLGKWLDGISLVGPQGVAGTPGTAGPTGPAGANYTLPKAPVLATGQVKSYAVGDDGDWMLGASLPATQRFLDNNDGTVKDNLTGLIWLKDANCFGQQTWAIAIGSANGLKGDGTQCSLNDGSTAGQWRLPNRTEFISLVDYSTYFPALPIGHPFGVSVQSNITYWSSSTYHGIPEGAWDIAMYDGFVTGHVKDSNRFVWPVRAGQ